MIRGFQHLISLRIAPGIGIILIASITATGMAQERADEAPSREAAKLIPAAFGIWTDRSGSSWSVEAAGNIGRIGSTMVNSGLALLLNDEKFVSQSPMMTPDGKELVLAGPPLESLPGLLVQRRVRLLEEPGGLRYTELFHNESADPIHLSVGLTTNFSGNFKTFLSDRGRSEPLLLGPSETGIVVLPGASQSSRAFLFTLAGGSGGSKPTISSQNRYGLTFRYDLELAPGTGAAIVHHVAQVVIPQSFDRRTLLQLGRPFALDGLRAGFDPDWADEVTNALEPAGFSARSVFESGGSGTLETTSGSEDILASGGGTRLVGKAEGGPARIVSNYGEAEFALGRIAAIIGERGTGSGTSRLFLRDGQVISGAVEVPGLVFLPTGGSRLALEPAGLDRLVFAGTSGKPAWPAGAVALVETHEGDRIKVTRPDALTLPLATPWGMRQVALGDLLWLGPATGGMPGYRVEFRDGTRLHGFADLRELMIAGTDLGDLSLPVSRLHHILTPGAVERDPGTPVPIAGTAVHLLGDQTLVGPVSDTTLSILAESGVIETAFAEIRRLVRLDLTSALTAAEHEAPRFRVERWDGGTIVGSPRTEFLAVEVAARTWQIPLRDIAAIDFASPALSPETLARIAGLVVNLASADWATRETATRELGAFGYLARSVLQRELANASDPEVERRLERVLSGMN